MFKFGHAAYLYGLLIIPVLVILFAIGLYWRKKALKRFGNPPIINQLMPYVSTLRPVIKFMLLILALTSVIFALADPQFGSKLKKVKSKLNLN